MDKEFVEANEAMALQKLGFNEPCIAYYVQKLGGIPLRVIWEEQITSPVFNSDGFNIPAPLYQQAFKFFREKGFGINIYSKDNEHKEWFFLIERPVAGRETNDDIEKTYEYAELACLKKLINLMKYNG